MMAIVAAMIFLVFLLCMKTPLFRKANNMLIILGLTLIIVAFISFCNTRGKYDKKSIEDYLKQEHDSHYVPRKDISGLDYLKVDFARLPLTYWEPGEGTPSEKKKNARALSADFSSDDDEISMILAGAEALRQNETELSYDPAHMESLKDELAGVEYEICAFAEKKILNLNAYSNIEIRMAYGTANLEPLTVCDQNFTSLIRSLQKWGSLLVSAGRENDARTVLAYAVEIGSDIAGTYTLLGKLYQKSGEIDKIKELHTLAQGLTTLMKPSILNDLEVMLVESGEVL